MCGTTYSSLQLGIPIQNPGIPGSRTIFSIPNPGIGDALIPGFRDYEKRTIREFYLIFAKKLPFPEFLGPIPGSEAESERTRPQHQIRDQVGHRSTGAIVLNKLFMRL